MGTLKVDDWAGERVIQNVGERKEKSKKIGEREGENQKIDDWNGDIQKIGEQKNEIQKVDERGKNSKFIKIRIKSGHQKKLGLMRWKIGTISTKSERIITVY